MHELFGITYKAKENKISLIDNRGGEPPTIILKRVYSNDHVEPKVSFFFGRYVLANLFVHVRGVHLLKSCDPCFGIMLELHQHNDEATP